MPCLHELGEGRLVVDPAVDGAGVREAASVRELDDALPADAEAPSDFGSGEADRVVRWRGLEHTRNLAP